MAKNRGGGGGQGGGGGTQGGGDLKPELFLDGTRDKVEISVRVKKGQFLLAGQDVSLFLGTENQPSKVQLKRANGSDWIIRSGDLGIAVDTLDLHTFDAKDYSHLTAVVKDNQGHIAYMTKVLPTDVKLPGAKPKVKRFKMLPEGDVIESTNGTFSLTVITLDPAGKNRAAGQIRFTAPLRMKIKNLTDKRSHTGRSITIDVDASGMADLELSFSDEVKCQATAMHMDSLETITKTFHLK